VVLCSQQRGDATPSGPVRGVREREQLLVIGCGCAGRSTGSCPAVWSVSTSSHTPTGQQWHPQGSGSSSDSTLSACMVQQQQPLFAQTFLTHHQPHLHLICRDTPVACDQQSYKYACMCSQSTTYPPPPTVLQMNQFKFDDVGRRQVALEERFMLQRGIIHPYNKL